MAVFQLFFCRDTGRYSPAASVNQGLRARLEAGTAGLLAWHSFDSVLPLQRCCPTLASGMRS